MDIKDFLKNSYTCFHAVENSRNFLLDNGFKPYEHGQKLTKGDKYFIEKNGSTLIAFKIGDLTDYLFNIALAHTDSPVLRIKGANLIDSPEGKRINVEGYGGFIKYTFMNIPLVIAGRVFVKSGGGLVQKLVKSNFNVNIPSLCIHHSPDVNEKAYLSVQQDMLPLLGKVEGDLYSLLCPNEEVVDGDLFVVPDVEPFTSGISNQFLCSPRIDNLTSCYALLQGIVDSNSKGVSVAVLFDNEEIGSYTKQGAKSEVLHSLLKEINSSLGKTDFDYTGAINNGFILSIDNGHAVHPAHPEKSDPKERVYLNEGIVIKHHTNYSTDGFSSACLKLMLDKNNIKYQDYYNNSDIRCGGTLGLFVSSQLEMNAVDIGLAQLAMHSSIELVGNQDLQLMIDCAKSFYQTSFLTKGNNIEIK